MRARGLALVAAGTGAQLVAAATLAPRRAEVAAFAMLALAGLHLAGAVMVAEGARRVATAAGAPAEGAYGLALVSGLFLPAFGLLLTLPLAARPPRGARQAADEEAPMVWRARQAKARIAEEVRRRAIGAGIEAIADALTDEDRQRRLGAVEALRAMERPEAVALLARSLRNSDPEVRTRAAEALADINARVSARIAEAAERAERAPTPANLRALGDAYFAYAELGMEEAAIEQHLYRTAAATYERAAAGEPDVSLAIRLATCLERMGSLAAAEARYEAIAAANPRAFEARLGAVRVAYRRRQFDRLAQACRAALAAEPPGRVDPDTLAALAHWADGGGERAEVAR